MDLDGFIWLDECVRALLAHAVFSTERHSVPDGEGFTEAQQRKDTKGEELDNEQGKQGCSDFVYLHDIQVHMQN